MVLISYFKSMNGKVTEIESCEPGCWIRCIAPTNDEINSLIAEFAIEPDFFVQQWTKRNLPILILLKTKVHC